jgi:1-acyl-sn-glycerol-3-phosphate acyltransferase
MRVPSRVARRVALPIYLALFGCLIGLFAIGVVIGVLLAPFNSHQRLFRVSAFGICYCLTELVVLAATGALWMLRLAQRLLGVDSEERWHRWHRWLLQRALSWVIGGARHLAGFRLLVSDASIKTFSDRQPSLVLARHGGPGDSFVLVHLLLTRYERDVRIVLKDALQIDPALDLLLNRLQCCFLPPQSGGRSADLIGSAAAALQPGTALLLFPEGANWTPKRRQLAIRRFRSRHQTEELRTAELLSNVLAPRLSGVSACLDAQPDIEVVMAAHAGLDHLVSAHQLWKDIPFSDPMGARLWQASPPPPDEGDRAVWLVTEWAVVDQWIDAYHAHEIDQPAPDDVAGANP